jgi:hypothetical protein
MQETDNDGPGINGTKFKITLKKKWFGRLYPLWHEDEKTLDTISGITGLVIMLLCFTYPFIGDNPQTYIHLFLTIGCTIIGLCEYQVARLYNKSYIPVYIGTVLALLNLLCFIGYIV